MTNPDPNEYRKRFRRISHPRKDLLLTKDSIDYLVSKNRIVPDVSARAVFMELSNYYDPFDSGLDIGHKQIRHSEDRDTYNKTYFDWEMKPSTSNINRFEASTKLRWWRNECHYKSKRIDDTRLNADKIYQHITGQKVIYGTMNPFSPVRVLGGDTDNETDDPAAILQGNRMKCCENI